MEKNNDLYKDLLMMVHMMDLIYADYLEKIEREEQEKEKSEDDALSTPSSEHYYSSLSSHHSNEEASQSLRVENAKLRRLLREENQEKQRLQL